MISVRAWQNQQNDMHARLRLKSAWALARVFAVHLGSLTAVMNLSFLTDRFGPLRSAIIFWELRNKWLVKTHILDRCLFIWFGPHFDLYQSLNHLPIWNLWNCSMFPLAFIAGWLQGHWWGFISRNYVVWPTFLLMNVFIALKGSHFWFLFEQTLEEQSDQGLHCLQFCLHLFSALIYSKATLFKF